MNRVQIAWKASEEDRLNRLIVGGNGPVLVFRFE
jgi:hypothetical protein